MRAIVLHPGALGDVLLAVPALRALRGQAADAELVLVAQPHIGRLLAALAIVDGQVTFDTLGLEALFADDEAPARLHRLLDGARVVSWFGRRDAGFVRRLRALAPGAVVSSSVPSSDDVTVWEHLASAVASPAGVAWREPIAVPAAMTIEGRRALAAMGRDGARPLVVLHPGAGGAAKRWAPEGFVEVAAALVDALGADLVVHDGPADRDAVASVRARLRVPSVRLADPSLEILAGVLSHAALWVGNDSGVTHLAAAVGAPTLALFTRANLAWRPWAPRARVRVIAPGSATRRDVEAVIADATALIETSVWGARG